jgi:hypothetical protein
LNSDEALTLCRAKYPHCELPTIITFLRQWHDHSVARGFPMREGLVWQEDVRNAFGQVTHSVDSAKRSCVSLQISPAARQRARAHHRLDLPSTIFVIFLWCYFGWCGASLAFNTFTIWLREVLSAFIHGVHDIYVDDLTGYGHSATVREDQQMAQKVIVTTMGDGALAREKSKPPGPTPTVIGWYVDFPAMTVLPSPKGRRKLLFAFFSVSAAPNWK